MKPSLTVFTDGGARGNPGPAAIGFIVQDNQGRTLIKQGKYIGQATNNVAEYTAVIEALKWLLANDLAVKGPINFYLDSKLVVNQLNGLFKVKNQRLRELIVQVRTLEQEAGGRVFYQFIPRQKNQNADFLVNDSFE